MKKIFTFVMCALVAAAAWGDVKVITLDLNAPLNPDNIAYNDNGVWTGCYNDEDFTWLEFDAEGGEFMLSHLIDGPGASWGGYYWDGFTPAIGGDQTDYGQPGSSASWTTNFGGCMAGGGCVINEDGSVTADPNMPYLVAYYSSWAMEGPSNQVMFLSEGNGTLFEPVGVYVCNHPWPYYGCVHGDGMARAFEEGDYFELIAHGVKADRSETTVSMNLVEFTNGQLVAANDWTFFDLSGLGEVESVYFTLYSTDTGDWGMNTASYFCMDKFQVKVGDPDPIVYDGTCLAPNSRYEITGYEKATVTITNREPGATVVYEVYCDGVFVDSGEFTGDSYSFDLTGAGSYVIHAIATLPGKNDSPDGGVFFTIIENETPPTGIDELVNGKQVAGVRYFNMAG